MDLLAIFHSAPPTRTVAATLSQVSRINAQSKQLPQYQFTDLWASSKSYNSSVLVVQSESDGHLDRTIGAVFAKEAHWQSR